jgi:hypothetical protein
MSIHTVSAPEGSESWFGQEQTWTGVTLCFVANNPTMRCTVSVRTICIYYCLNTFKRRGFLRSFPLPSFQKSSPHRDTLCQLSDRGRPVPRYRRAKCASCTKVFTVSASLKHAFLVTPVMTATPPNTSFHQPSATKVHQEI